MRLTAWNQVDPYSVEIAGDTGIAEHIVALDQLERFLDAAQSGVRLRFRGSDPKPVNFATG